MDDWGLALGCVGDDGPGDGHGGVPVWAVTVTTLMTLSARCALMMLADLLQAASQAAAADAAGIGEGAAVAPGGHGDGAAAEWFVHARHGTSGP